MGLILDLLVDHFGSQLTSTMLTMVLGPILDLGPFDLSTTDLF